MITKGLQSPADCEVFVIMGAPPFAGGRRHTVGRKGLKGWC